MKFKFIYIFLMLFISVGFVYAGGFEEDPGPEEMVIIEDEVLENREILIDQDYNETLVANYVAPTGTLLSEIDDSFDNCTTSKTIVMWSEGCVQWSEGYALWSGVGW